MAGHCLPVVRIKQQGFLMNYDNYKQGISDTWRKTGTTDITSLRTLLDKITQ